MQLHILNQPPSHSSWHEALLAVAAGDAIVLMQDAVYALIEDTCLKALLAKGVACYIMQDDLQLRGIPTTSNLSSLVKAVIDSRDLVKLSLQAKHCITWH